MDRQPDKIASHMMQPYNIGLLGMSSYISNKYVPSCSRLHSLAGIRYNWKN